MSKFTAIAAFLGFLGVMLGAFGAHGLEERLAANGHLDTWETATLYLFVHAIALLTLSALSGSLASKSLRLVGYFWIAGVIVFSGSLYILALSNFTKLGMITPLGGLCFLLGWLLLALCGLKGPKSDFETSQE